LLNQRHQTKTLFNNLDLTNFS